jgi:hypothetical protein
MDRIMIVSVRETNASPGRRSMPIIIILTRPSPSQAPTVGAGVGVATMPPSVTCTGGSSPPTGDRPPPTPSELSGSDGWLIRC